MAKGEIVKPGEIVKANNGLFRCKYKIKDVVAARIFMAFASLVDHKDVKENQSFVEYKIAASSVIQNIDAGGDYYNQIREAAFSLVDHKIELRVSKKEFYVYTLFSKIGYKEGIITGEFHKDLMPFFLIAKEKFTKMKLSEYMRLPSIYSQLIFSFLKSWDDKREIIVKLTELHEMLDTPESFRKDFRQFRIRVLEKAYKDINEKTNLGFEFEAIKNGRAVSEIKFKFVKKRKTPTSATPQGIALVQAALGLEPPNPKYKEFEGFLRKFPGYNGSRFEALKIWGQLYDKGVAPFAQDVEKSNNLSVVEFLKNWNR